MDQKFMILAVEEAKKGLKNIGEGPFGACIVKNGKVIAVGNNTVVKNNDPTAHAEINAIRKACKKLSSFKLNGCDIYSICEPCPMCLAAIYWARLDKLYFGCTRFEAAQIGFDDQLFYDELQKPLGQRKLSTVPNVCHKECFELFKIWEKKTDRIDY